MPTKEEIKNRIEKTVNECGDFNWHSWHWWKLKDDWFAQFDPNYIDELAQELVTEGRLEGSKNKGEGVRKIPTTLKEKIMIKICELFF